MMSQNLTAIMQALLMLHSQQKYLTVKCFEFQNISNVLFTMDNSCKGENLYLREVFGASIITLIDFRREFDHFRNALDETDNLWIRDCGNMNRMAPKIRIQASSGVFGGGSK